MKKKEPLAKFSLAGGSFRDIALLASLFIRKLNGALRLRYSAFFVSLQSVATAAVGCFLSFVTYLW